MALLLGSPAHADHFPVDLAHLDGVGVRFTGFNSWSPNPDLWSVAGAGDFNDDGYDDVVAGAPMAAASPTALYTGASFVVLGSASPTDLDLPTPGNAIRINGAAAYSFSGRSVAAAGDVNNDGYDDIIIGAPNEANNGPASGSAYVVYGSETPPTSIDLANLGSAGFRMDGEEQFQAGSAVAGAGDVNNDGYDDVVAGAPFGMSGGYLESGVSYIVYGSASQSSPIDLENLGSAGIRIGGEEISWSGHSVAGAGDVNRDGYDDVIIGAPDAWPSGSTYKTGAGYVILGGQTLTDVDLASMGSAGFRIAGGHPYSSTGWSVAGARDVNNDGYDDVIIGAWEADGGHGSASGVSYVVFGTASPGAIDLAALGGDGFRINGAAAGDNSGRSVAGVGDVNYDRYDDVMVGAPGADNNNRDSSGSSYVVFGGKSPSTVDLTDIAQAGYRIDGANAGNRNGLVVAGAGDVNDDRVQDLLTRAPFEGAGTDYLLTALPATYTLPAAPTDVSGVPGNGQVELSWTAPDNGGAAISGYRIESDGGGSWDVDATTNHTVTGLTNGTAYRFRVAAINAAGTGPGSTWSTAVTPLAPAEPAPSEPTPSTPAGPTPAASLTVTARSASKAVPRTGRAALVTKVAVGPGQTATIKIAVKPARAKKKITVKRSSTTVAVRTKKAPKATVRVDVTSQGAGVTPTSWTRTWKVR